MSEFEARLRLLLELGQSMASYDPNHAYQAELRAEGLIKSMLSTPSGLETRPWSYDMEAAPEDTGLFLTYLVCGKPTVTLGQLWPGKGFVDYNLDPVDAYAWALYVAPEPAPPLDAVGGRE